MVDFSLIGSSAVIVMATLWNRAGHYIFALWFLSSAVFFPCLISAVAEWILYCAPAWSGMCSAADRARLNSLLHRAKRLNYCTDDFPPIAELFSDAGNDFFHRINTNSNHVLQLYLPDNNKLTYQLRTCHHNKSLIIKTDFFNYTDFIVRMLYIYILITALIADNIYHDLFPQPIRICCHHLLYV